MEVENLTKKYGDKIIFENITKKFSNKIYHLIAENGAGKSVFLRTILGNEEKTSGSIRIDKENILYLLDTPVGEDYLNVLENVKLLLYYYGIKIDDSKIISILQALGINDYEQNYQILSYGTQIKIGLFLLYIDNYWDLIVLDESLSHIDIETKKNIICELEKRTSEKTTAIIVDHSIRDDFILNQNCWEKFLL